MAEAWDLEHIPFARLTPEQRIIRWDAEAGKPTRFVAMMRRLLEGAGDQEVEAEFEAEAGSGHVYRLALNGQLSSFARIDMGTTKEKETGRLSRKMAETAVKLLKSGVPVSRAAQMAGVRAEIVAVLAVLHSEEGDGA